jgi:hypothetical protein
MTSQDVAILACGTRLAELRRNGIRLPNAAEPRTTVNVSVPVVEHLDLTCPSNASYQITVVSNQHKSGHDHRARNGDGDDLLSSRKVRQEDHLHVAAPRGQRNHRTVELWQGKSREACRYQE